MAKRKFYAVRAGRAPGIYGTWDECKRQVDGFPGASYKSFGTMAEAERYMSAAAPAGTGGEAIETGFVPELPYAFTDGSYNPETAVAGWGGFLVVDGDTRIELSGAVTDPEWNAMRNVAGETCGALDAVAHAIELGLDTLHIYYDYQGIEAWPTGAWQANKACTRLYADAMRAAGKAGLEIKYHKVRAHTGIPGNEAADLIAKRAAGLA